ncbi:hypothetical protein [Saccharopolyspora sp. NPDC002376]
MPADPERETYLDDLVPLVAQLVGAVHDEGPGATRDALAAIRAVPAPDGMSAGDALAVMLAAMVDPTRSPRALLAWTDRLDHGHAGVHPAPAPRCNPIAVEMALAGRLPLHALAPHEARVVVAQLADRGMSAESIADHVAAEPGRVRRILTAARPYVARKVAA